MRPSLRLSLPLAVMVTALALTLPLGSCSSDRAATGLMDTPDHHALRGDDMVDKGEWEKAEREYDLALSLDKEFSLALSGKAVVEAHKGYYLRSNQAAREKAFDTAEDWFKKALKKAKSDKEKRTAHLAALRSHAMTQMPEKWLEEAKEHYQDALKTDPKEEEADPHYFMAQAYRGAYKLNDAVAMYGRVLEMNKGRVGEADREMDLVQKVIRAQPGSLYGRKVAFQESLSRADVAALFLGELKLERIYTRDPRLDTRFQTPGEFQSGPRKAVDIDTHPMRNDIEEVIALGVAGLQPDGSGRFYPDRPLTRAEFAVMVEDLVAHLTGEKDLKTKFIGAESSLRDVRSDMPYFNAVQTVTSRNLMEPEDRVRGVFNPSGNMTGVDALLVLRAVKVELKSYLR